MYSILFPIIINFSVLALHINKMTVYRLTGDEKWANEVTAIDNEATSEALLSYLIEKDLLTKHFIDENGFIKFMKSLHQTIGNSVIFVDSQIEFNVPDEKDRILVELASLNTFIDQTENLDRVHLKCLYNAVYHHSFICYEFYEESEDMRDFLKKVMDNMSVRLQKFSSPGISTKSPLKAIKFLDLLPISHSNIKIIPSKLGCLNDQAVNSRPYFYPSLSQDIYDELQETT